MKLFPLALLALLPQRLTQLAPVDILILALYFGLVVFIGFYAKGKANTSEDFFLAGREMTAWIAGLSFVSANLGSLELMGWAGSAYQYGILAAHWYWIGAIPAMLFLGVVMMPFYYISKTHSVPGYLHLRFGEGARLLSAVSFAIMTILMSGVNMYAMAVVMQTILGWNITFSIWVGAGTVALYVMLGGLRSAIINEVLQFVLIWAGAAMIPILGLIEAGGWTKLKAQIAVNVGNSDYTHMWTTLGHFKSNPMGVHWTGIVFGLGFVISFGYWTTDFLVVQRVLSANNLRAAKMAPVIGAAFKMAVPFIVILPGLLALAVLKNPDGSVMHLVASNVAKVTGQHSYDEVLPLMLIRYCGPGLLGPRHHRAHRRLHERHGRQRQRLLHRLDLRHLRRLPQQKGQRQALRRHGPLVDRHRHAGLHHDRLPGHERQQHHGLRPGAVQLLHRSALRHRHPRHDVEARHQKGRLLRPARRHRRLHRHVRLGPHRRRRPQVHRHEPRRPAHGREPLPRPLELDHLRRWSPSSSA